MGAQPYCSNQNHHQTCEVLGASQPLYGLLGIVSMGSRPCGRNQSRRKPTASQPLIWPVYQCRAVSLEIGQTSLAKTEHGENQHTETPNGPKYLHQHTQSKLVDRPQRSQLSYPTLTKDDVCLQLARCLLMYSVASSCVSGDRRARERKYRRWCSRSRLNSKNT